MIVFMIDKLCYYFFNHILFILCFILAYLGILSNVTTVLFYFTVSCIDLYL